MQTSFVKSLVYQGVQKSDRGVLMLFRNNRNGLALLKRGNSTHRPYLPNCTAARRMSSDAKESENNLPLDQYDIVIAGGGLVGTALACLLGREPILQHHRILVVEAAPKIEPMVHAPHLYSNRVSAITPGTKKLLDEIDAWSRIKNLRHKSFSKMHVWDACGAGYITFNADAVDRVSEDDGSNSMAYIIENSVILSAMSEKLQDGQQNVQVIYSSQINDIEFPQNTAGKSGQDALVKITLSNGDEFTTKLLIGADGINSFVRSKAKMRYLAHDYEQTAVVATLHLEKDIPNEVAWQRFLPTGPIALLPLSENRSSLVWSTTPVDAQSLMNVPEDEFVDSVNNALVAECDRHPLIDQSASVLQNVISAVQPGTFAGSQLQQPPTIVNIDKGSRAMYPLGLGHSSHYVNSRVALIGDAAHRVHPLAGQGVNLGASDVSCIRDVLVEAVENGSDIGDLDHLLEYETRRQREVIPMMTAIDTLKRLFSTSFFPFVFARTLGLQATNALTPLKEEIIKHAMK